MKFLLNSKIKTSTFPFLIAKKKLTLFSLNFKNTVAPSVSLVFGSSRGNELLEGSDIFFQCNVHSNPVVSNVQWLFNGKLLIEELKSNQIDQTSYKQQSTNSLHNDIEPNSNFTDQSNSINNKIHYDSLDKSIQLVDERTEKELNFEPTDNDYVGNRTFEDNQFEKERNSHKRENSNKNNNFNKLRKRKMAQTDENVIQLPSISISARSLLLKGASDKHTGEYKCMASNGKI